MAKKSGTLFIRENNMTQAHKQQYKYKVTGDSFKEKTISKAETSSGSNVVVSVIAIAIIYIVSRI